MAPIRVGLDVTAAVQQGAGIGRYTRELLRALAHLDLHSQYRLFFASRARPEPLPPLGPNFHVTALPFHDIWLARLWQRAQLPLPVEWLTGPVDIFHSPDFTLPPTQRGTRTLLTVHDLTFVRDPESAAPGLLRYLTVVVPRSVKRAQHIIAVSQATRRDLIELYNTPPEKISVIYEGVGAEFQPVTDPTTLNTLRAKYGLGSGAFILAVGTLQPRKNYLRLIQAFAPLAAQHTALKLVIAGGKGWLFDSIFSEVERLQLTARVLFPGFVDDADLPALYSAARVFAYPSIYEGFGLPLLEAMACGTPVLTSTTSCLPEIAGEAALLVPPTDVPALTAALEKLLTADPLRATLIERGLARAKRFSWDIAAREVLALYAEMMKT